MEEQIKPRKKSYGNGDNLPDKEFKEYVVHALVKFGEWRNRRCQQGL